MSQVAIAAALAVPRPRGQGCEVDGPADVKPVAFATLWPAGLVRLRPRTASLPAPLPGEAARMLGLAGAEGQRRAGDAPAAHQEQHGSSRRGRTVAGTGRADK